MAYLKTGQKVEVKGDYVFEKYVDSPFYTPSPTEEERILPLDVGDVVPPIRSANRAAYYRLR